MTSRRELGEELSEVEKEIELVEARGWSQNDPEIIALAKQRDDLKKAIAGDHDIRTPEMLKSHLGAGLAFPASTRREMETFLLDHPHYFDNGKLYISWNIKIRDYVEASSEEFDFDPAFDDVWQDLLQKDAEIFSQALDNALRRYIEGDYVAEADPHGLKSTFATAGRSGGHLLLTGFQSIEPNGENKRYDAYVLSERDLRTWIEEEIDDTDLAALYGLVVNVDVDVADRVNLVALELGAIRAGREEQYAEENGASSSL
jgi:hypothetical protein